MAISQIIGTIGVITSLIFVGVQIRYNTKATRARIHQDLTNSYLLVASGIPANAATFAKGISATPESFGTLTDEEKTVYFSVIFAFFKHFEYMHAQYQHGLIDKVSWSAWSEHILMYYNQSGVKLWWDFRREAFTPNFRSFLESSPPSKLPSMVQVLQGVVKG